MGKDESKNKKDEKGFGGGKGFDVDWFTRALWMIKSGQQSAWS